MTQKVQVSQDALYEYLLAHDVIITRLAEQMGKSINSLSSCFKHNINIYGQPLYFNKKNIERINEALPIIANEIRGLILKFGSDQVFTNSCKRTYDPGLVEPLKAIGKYLNITALTERLLGWSKKKKEAILVVRSSKAYGHISEADALAINTELLSVAAVLESYEVIPSEVASESSSSE